MKKILVILFIFISSFQSTFWYIDYRYTMKKDYLDSIYILSPYIKEKLDLYIKKVWNNIVKKDFEKRVEIIEKQKSFLLNFLFKWHILKNDIRYYIVSYLYNWLDKLKFIKYSKYLIN